MSFRKVRLFPIVDHAGAFPTYDKVNSFALQKDKDEINSIEISFTQDKKEKTLSADDKVKKINKVVGFGGTLKVYDMTDKAKEKLFGYVIDNDGNLLETINENNQEYGLFFETEDTDGEVYQKYVYDIKFSTPSSESFVTDSGDTVPELELEFTGTILDVNGHEVKAFNVKKGNPKFVDDVAAAIDNNTLDMLQPVFSK